MSELEGNPCDISVREESDLSRSEGGEADSHSEASLDSSTGLQLPLLCVFSSGLIRCMMSSVMGCYFGYML